MFFYALVGGIFVCFVGMQQWMQMLAALEEDPEMMAMYNKLMKDAAFAEVGRCVKRCALRLGTPLYSMGIDVLIRCTSTELDVNHISVLI